MAKKTIIQYEINRELFGARRRAKTDSATIERAVANYMDTVRQMCLDYGITAKHVGEKRSYTFSQETIDMIEEAHRDTGLGRAQLIRAALYCLKRNLKKRKVRIWWQCTYCEDRTYRLANWRGANAQCGKCKKGTYIQSTNQRWTYKTGSGRYS